MKHSKPLASIVICTYNDDKFLKQFIESILSQTYSNFELILLDDCSSDSTPIIVHSFADRRLRYYRLKKHVGNMGKLRNISLRSARGDYVFFTDTDCVVRKDWLQKGIFAFEKYHCLGIEGRVLYVSEGYKPVLSDREVSNPSGGRFMTANMAFHSSVFRNMKFNPNYPFLEDRELAIRVNSLSKIIFIKNCIVYHQRKTRTISGFVNEAKRYNAKVRLIKELHEPIGNPLKILNIKYFLVLFLPFLIFFEVIVGRVRSWHDLKLLPFVWVKALMVRLTIWKASLKYGVFVI